ncbi:MAG: hypothetical protein K2J08_01955 [Ruminococcus sp.]|nr:hypothetical protein [Ruminococcus sp.]
MTEKQIEEMLEACNEEYCFWMGESGGCEFCPYDKYNTDNEYNCKNEYIRKKT